MGRIGYRVGQFWQMLTAEPLPAGVHRQVAAALPPAQLDLFDRFSANDQWHSYRVYQMLRETGREHPDLLTAALLHDVGKTRVSIGILERSLVVAMSLIWPERVRAWGSGAATGWKRPFAVKVQHPAWGAEMAAAAGANPLAVSLIRRHQDPLPPPPHGLEDRLLGYLQRADDQN